MCTAASLTTGSPLPAGPVAAACASKSCFKPGCPAFPLPKASEEGVNMPITISPSFIGEILRPYRPISRYLKEAVITHFRDKASEGPAATSGLITAEGKFAIEESCYIDDTGHFNAVEFNLCFNQLAYYVIAASVKHRLIDAFANWDIDEYRRRQLPDILIAKMSAQFARPVHGAAFDGWLDITKVSKSSKGHIFLTMEVAFTDKHDGFAEGEVTLAIVSRASK
jgi:hypothetical protein